MRASDNAVANVWDDYNDSGMLMQGYKHRRNFIATQGPLETTVSDLWRMVWEQKNRVIVMLCNLEEDGQVRIAQPLLCHVGSWRISISRVMYRYHS